MLKGGIRFAGFWALALLLPTVFAAGCVSTGGTAMEAHKKGMTSITEEEYFVTKKPVDKAFIGCAWSKQFGPVEDPVAADIRVKKERSLSSVQQDFAYNLGIGLGGQATIGPKAEIGAQGGSVEKAKLSGLEIISPVSLADIPFELKIPYVTEALRLNNFAISSEQSNKAGLNVGVGIELGSITATTEVGSQARKGTEGEGLVVAYKLNMIDPATYVKKESGNLPLELDKVTDFSRDNIFATARLMLIDPGAGKSLPRNVVWACPKADAKSKDMVAAWVVDLKSMDPKRRKLTIAFPGWPVIEDCQNYSGVIYSRIDPLTDKLIRQRVNIAVINAELTDSMKPKKWDARMSLIDESFNIKLVRPADLEAASQ